MGLIAFDSTVVGVATLIVAGACSFCLLGRWLEHRPSWTSRMKFKQWLELYYLCPKEWCLDDTPNRLISGNISKRSYWAYVHFSFPDYLRYRFWKRSEGSRKKSIKQDERLKDVLELAQSDIERLKQQADREMEEAKRQAKETSRRMNETTRTASGEVSISRSPWAKGINARK